MIQLIIQNKQNYKSTFILLTLKKFQKPDGILEISYNIYIV